jgi:hypothetical protein
VVWQELASESLAFLKLSGPAACHAVLSPPRLQASSGLVLRPRAADDYDDDSVASVRLAWKAWMKKEVTVEGLSCDVLDWWKANSARFPLIAKAAKIVLATPASVSDFSSGPSTLEQLIGWHELLMRPLRCSSWHSMTSRHGGVETIEVIMR